MDTDSLSLADLLNALKRFPTIDAYSDAPDAERDRFHQAEDELVRRALDDSLNEAGAIIDALIAGLQTDHWGLRTGAIYALGAIRPVRAVQPLIEAFRDDVSSMAEIASALVSIGTIAVRPLIHALTDQPDPAVRRGAALTLARFRDPLAVPALIDRLTDDPDASVRTFAAHALAPLRDARAVQPLIDVLDADPDPQVREAAARSLGEIGALLRDPGLIAALRRALADPDWGVRQSAAEMLILLNEDDSGGARALLIADLTHPDAATRLGAAWSLLAARDPHIIDPLVRLLYNPEAQIVASAARALGQAGDRRAVPALEALRTHSDPAVRHAVHDALNRLLAQE